MNRYTPIEAGALMNAARTPADGSPRSIHRISGKARIAQFVMLAMMSGGGIFVLVETLFGSAASNANEKVLFSIAGSGFIAAAIFLAIRVARYRVQVLEDRIRIQGAFAMREILATDITGFRRVADGYAHTYLRLILRPPGKPADLHRNLERSAEFEQWLGARACDLDRLESAQNAREHAEALTRILSDVNLGTNEDARAFQVAAADKLVTILGIATFIFASWGGILPWPYALTCGVLLILPWTALLSTRLFVPGLVQFAGSKAQPQVALPFVAPSLILAIRGALDWDFLDWSRFWIPFAVVSLVLFVPSLVLFEQARSRPRQLVWILVSCLLYGFGATRVLNGYLDRSTPSTYRAIALEMLETQGKNHDYDIRISSWGPKQGTEVVDVHRSLFRALGPGDSIDVELRQGWMGIPWYRVNRYGPGCTVKLRPPFR